jgi:hypothetical protein
MKQLPVFLAAGLTAEGEFLDFCYLSTDSLVIQLHQLLYGEVTSSTACIRIGLIQLSLQDADGRYEIKIAKRRGWNEFRTGANQ